MPAVRSDLRALMLSLALSLAVASCGGGGAVDALPPTPSSLFVQGGDNQVGTVGQALALPLSVVARDRLDNPIPGVSVTWTVSGGGSVSASTSTTDPSGVASVTYTLGPTAGLQTAQGSVSGLPPATFRASAEAGPAAQLAIAGGDNQQDTVLATLATRLSVVVRDQNGNPTPGVVVNWTYTGGASVASPTSTSDATGMASVICTLGPKAVTQWATATVPGLQPVTFTEIAVAGNAAVLAGSGGNNQSGPVGSTLAAPYTVTVKDAHANPKAGVAVNWAVATGGGTITPAQSTTDAGGVTTATRTLGSVAGTQTATASVAGLSGSPVTFTATAVSGGPASISIVAGNSQQDTVLATLATPHSVVVKDVNTNPVPGVTVSWSVSGGGSVSSATSTTNASGIASVTRTLGPTVGTQTAQAVASGLTPVAFTATAVAGNAAVLVKTGGDNQTGAVSGTLPVAYTVTIKDAHDNTKAGVVVTWTVATGGGTITPSQSTTNSSGVASATRTLGPTDGIQTATATVAGLAGSPATFTATAVSLSAPTMQLAGGNNQQDTVLATLATPYSVVIRDPTGAPVPGIVVTWSVSGGGSASSAITTTNANGIATVTRTLGAVAGTHTAQAAATGVTGSPLTFTATAVAGNAAVLAYGGGNNQSGPVGSILPTPYAVTARDAHGNVKGGVVVNWAVVTGGGSLSPIQSTTNTNGTATATRTLGTTAGTQTATASAPGLTGSPVTFSATAVASAPSTVSVVGGNNQQDTVLATLVTPYSVAVKDQYGNPVSGVAVTWSVSGGSINPAQSATNASGAASATRTLGLTAGTQSAQAIVTGLTPATFTATALAGNPAALWKSGGDNQTGNVGTTLPVPYSVTVSDAYGNAKAGVVVSWAVATGGGSITPSQSTTNTSAVANATRTLGPTAGTHTATATVSSVATVTFSATAVGVSSSAAVDVRDDYYSPQDATVALNGTVTWTWRGSDAHNVVFEDGPMSALQNTGTYSRTFTSTGTYRYRCTRHSGNFTSGMVGSVTAQ